MNVWDVFWFLLVFVPLAILWTITLVDMMGRSDLLGWQKAIWAMVIVFFPWIGVFAYLLTRPRATPFPAYAGGSVPSQTYSPQRAPAAGPTTAVPASVGPTTAEPTTAEPTTAEATTSEPTQVAGNGHAAQA